MEEHLIEKNGYMYLVQLHDVYGKNQTIHNLGKVYKEKEDEPKKTKQKKSEE